MTTRAVLHGVVLAESSDVVSVEGNAYFPPDSVKWDKLSESGATSRCWWKGQASYFDVVVGDATYPGVAWTYHKPWPLAAHITDYVAFWGDVRVESAD